jgi:hypothetical protein
VATKQLQEPRGPRKGARGERESGILAFVADELEFILKALPPPIFSVPEGRIAQAGLSIVDRREKPVPFRRLETRE